MDIIYIINDSINMDPEAYSDFYEAKERFLEIIKTVVKNTLGEIPGAIHADLDGLDDGDIEYNIDAVGLARYTFEGQEFTLYEREIKYPQ